jgi:glycosyltransferase involved in cell wall biosynthesis
MPEKAIDVFEKKLCEEVDIIFVTSKKLFNSRKLYNSECYYFTNVADYDHFSKTRNPDTQIPDDLKSIPVPRIGFIGALSGYKQDFNLLADLAKICTEFSFVLIGIIGEGDPLFKADEIQRIPNIYLLGERNYQLLPNYLKGFDAALIPACRNAYTDAMFPMKFFEYLAAGVPIVSTKLPALEEFSKHAFYGDTAIDFKRGITSILKNQIDFSKAFELAKNYTYEKRTKEMMNIVFKMDKKA